MVLDILSSAAGVIAWMGSVVLYWLFRVQEDGEWSALRRMLFWVAVAWTVSMIVETLHFTSPDLQVYIPWLGYFVEPDYQSIRKVTTWPIQAFAYWSFITYFLRPREAPALAIVEAQVTINTHGIILGWNAAATALLGWTAEEAKNQDMASLIIPEDLMIRGRLARELHYEGLAHLRETGHAPILDTYFPTFAICKNQKQIPVDLRVTKRMDEFQTTLVGQISPRSALQTAVLSKPPEG